MPYLRCIHHCHLCFSWDVSNHFGADTLFNTGLFTIFAFSFFGYYEIQLPSSWTNKADSAANQGGMLGIFFMAFSLSLVSFSCTGPLIGTLLVNAITIGYSGPITGMLGFSVALALPFTLFAAFPGWLNSLPRSGSWMTSVKVVLGFLELALGLKFLSVADLTMHWKILPYEAFIIAWAILLDLCPYIFLVLYDSHTIIRMQKFPILEKESVCLALALRYTVCQDS